MIKLRTLGGLELHDARGRELRVIRASSKPAALLTYLAIATPHGFHRRDTLLALLWPELDQEHARGALRQVLRVIRRSMTAGALLTEGDEVVAVDRDVFWCDAVAFELLLDGGKEEEALDLYRGALLEGFHLSGCLEFERWLEDERRRLEQRAAAATWSLAEKALTEGRTAQARLWGRRALAFSPNDESVLRRVIDLLDQVGDRAGAIREYETFAKRLQEDYEADPAPETTELIAAVRTREQANDSVLPSTALAKQPVVAAQASVATQPRTSPRTRSRAAAAIVVLGAIAVAGTTVMRNGRGDAPALDPTRVLVDIFQNETGDPALDPLGRMATDRVTAGLTYTSFVDVVSLGTRLLSLEPVAVDAASQERYGRLQALARANGTGTVVSGSYYLQNDSLHYIAHVTDAATGEELAIIEPIREAVDAPLAAIERLRDRVMTTLATLTDPQLARWMRNASQPPTFEAYAEFAKGVELYAHQERRGEALGHFLAADSLDSDFTMASLWAADLSRTSRQADSIRQALNGRRSQLAPLDREFLDYQMARRVEDYHGALDAMRRLVEIAPGSEFLWKAGQAALELGRYGEAIEFLTQVDPESGWLRGWWMYWEVLTSAHHWLGEHQEEEEAVRRGLRQFPNGLPLAEIRALAALGRIDELQAMLEKERILGLYQQAADELLIHGYNGAASQVLDRGMSRQQALPYPPQEPDGRVGAMGVAEMLFLNGRIDEARDSLEGFVAEWVARWGDRPAPLQYIAFLGVIAGIEGDRQRALEIQQYVGEQGWRGEYPQFMQALWQGRIAASLGEIERAYALLRPAFTGEDPDNVHHQLPLTFEILSDYQSHQESLRPTGSSPVPN